MRGGTAGTGIGNGDRAPAHQQARCEHANSCSEAQTQQTHHHLLPPANGPIASGPPFATLSHSKTIGDTGIAKLDTRSGPQQHSYDALEGKPLADDRHPQMINVYEHDNTCPAETKLPLGQCQETAERLLSWCWGSLTRGDRRVPARVTRRRSPPVIVPAASSLRSSADGQACSAKIAAFAVVFAEGTARCWWSPPSPPGYWWLRRPEFRALPLGVMPVVGQLPSPLHDTQG